MPNTFLYKNNSDTIALWGKRIHAFPKGIHPKVNIIAQLGFELPMLQSNTLATAPLLHGDKFLHGGEPQHHWDSPP